MRKIEDMVNELEIKFEDIFIDILSKMYIENFDYDYYKNDDDYLKIRNDIEILKYKDNRNFYRRMEIPVPTYKEIIEDIEIFKVRVIIEMMKEMLYE